MNAILEFPPKQQALYDALRGKGDVPISELYAAVFPQGGTAPAGKEQQWLGPYITKLNRRLARRGLAVKPGNTKGSYALVVQ